MTNEEMVARARELGITLYECPNSGILIVEGHPDDDKVICGCGKPNPIVVGTRLEEVEQRCYGHLVKYLKKVC